MSGAQNPYVVFEGDRRIATGSKLEVAAIAQARLAEDPGAPLLIFDPEGRQVDFDLRGGPWDLARRLGEAATEAPRGRGRPKLGVTAREVTLLPRHWEWLAAQPGGASVALRKLVEAARRETEGPTRRAAREAVYRFAQAMAGDRPGFEDAMRALFAGDAEGFAGRIAAWPTDVVEHLGVLATEAFESGEV